MTTLVADTETDGLLPTMTRLWCLTVGDPRTEEVDLYADQPGYPPISEGIARLQTATRIVFHNALGFDFFAINKVFPGALSFDQFYDSLVVSRLVDPESRAHSLGAWGERLGHAKPEHDEWDRWSPAMGVRCVEDTKIGIKVFRNLWRKSRDWGDSVSLEHQVRFAVALQEQNGFLLDLDAAHLLEAELRQEQNDIAAELQGVFHPIWVGRKNKGTGTIYPGTGKWGDMTRCVRVPKVGQPKGKGLYVKGAAFTKVEYQVFNPGSRQHIEGHLRRRGWTPTVFTPTGQAQLDDTTLADIAIIFPTAKPLARYFRVGKQLGQLADGDAAWLKNVHDDGRVRGSVNTNGAVTGRMSHWNPNLANVDKKDLRMRAVWIPREGWKLVGADAEGLELRMLAHFLKPYDGGAFERAVLEGNKEDGTDPHSVNQRLVGLYSRDQAKRVIYAMIYGAGNPKLGLIILEDADLAGKPRPKGSLAAIGKKARTRLIAGIVGMDKLLAKVQGTHKKQGYIRGLDGRRVKTRSAHSALNTLLQGAGAVVMKKALVIYHYELAVAAGWVSSDFATTTDFAYCVNVHDEVQMECAPHVAEQIGQTFAEAIRLAGVRLGIRCPLAGSSDVGDNWKDTH